LGSALSNSPGVEVIMAAHHGLAPLRRATGRGPVSEHCEPALVEQRRSHDADLIVAPTPSQNIGFRNLKFGQGKTAVERVPKARIISARVQNRRN
jgi:hypothetical protein